MLQHLGGDLEEEAGALLGGEASQEKHELFREFLLALEDLDRVRPVVDGKDFVRVNGVMAADDGARVLADRNDGVRLFHAEFFNVVNPAAGIRSGAVELGGVQVHHQGLARGLLHFYPGQVGHPVVGVDDVEVLLHGDFGRDLGKLNDLQRQVPGIEVFLVFEKL